jgi:hypothetical protein
MNAGINTAYFFLAVFFLEHFFIEHFVAIIEVSFPKIELFKRY